MSALPQTLEEAQKLFVGHDCRITKRADNGKLRMRQVMQVTAVFPGNAQGQLYILTGKVVKVTRGHPEKRVVIVKNSSVEVLD